MADKLSKAPESSTLEKHLGSKLFQKFLQKEGTKLSESSVLPKSPVPQSKHFAKPQSKPMDSEDYPEPKKKVPAPKPSVKKQHFDPPPSQYRDLSQNQYREPSPKQYRELSPPPHEEIYIQQEDNSYRDGFSKQTSLKFDEKSRSKWQDPEPYYSYKEEPQETYFSKDTELKGFSDYIPPGESFVYFESIQENPLVKPKAPVYAPYYPVIDPLIAIKSNNQEILNLEEQLREKEEDILRYKQDLENSRLDYADLEEKLADMNDLERKFKNLRVERDMLERKARGFEDENIDLQRQLDIVTEDLENMRYKVEDVERASRNKAGDMEREIRGHKDRISDLERELERERERGRNSNAKGKKKIEKVYEDDYRSQDKGNYYDDYQTYEYKGYENKGYEDKGYEDKGYEDKNAGYPYFDEEPSKAKKQGRAKRPETDFYNESKPDRGYQNKGYPDYQEKGYSDRNYYDNYEKPKPEKISDQVKARIGAANSNSVSSILNWGEKPKKNQEVLNIENKIFSLQTDKKRFEEELAKIPEHGKKIAVIRRREEIENELALIHSNIASLKIKAKQYQS